MRYKISAVSLLMGQTALFNFYLNQGRAAIKSVYETIGKGFIKTWDRMVHSGLEGSGIRAMRGLYSPKDASLFAYGMKRIILGGLNK